MSDTLLAWSQGRNRYDVQPRQHAGTLHEFAAAMRRAQAPCKLRAPYVCAPLGGDGRRCLTNALPRNWLALDLDHIDPEVFAEWRLFAARWLGLGWPTASSMPEQPRDRAIILLDQAVDRTDTLRLGSVLTRVLERRFGTGLRIDPCCFRPEQPAFVAPAGTRHFYLMGAPLDVAAWLAHAPPPRPPLPMPTAEQAQHWDARFRWLMAHMQDVGLLLAPLANGLGYRVRCPWSAQHSEGGADSATALLLPSEANGWHGSFCCLHAHCRTRRLRDAVSLFQAFEQRPTTPAEVSL